MIGYTQALRPGVKAAFGLARDDDLAFVAILERGTFLGEEAWEGVFGRSSISSEGEKEEGRKTLCHARIDRTRLQMWHSSHKNRTKDEGSSTHGKERYAGGTI